MHGVGCADYLHVAGNSELVGKIIVNAQTGQVPISAKNHMSAKVSCRFHDLRHTFISRLAESQASDSTVMALGGHVSRAMMERYSHIRMEAKRRAVDDLSGTDFVPGLAQNWL